MNFEMAYRIVTSISLPANAIKHLEPEPVHLERWREGVPLITVNVPEIDNRSFWNVLLKVVDVLREYRGDAECFSRFLEVIDGEIENLLSAFLLQNVETVYGFARRNELPVELVVLTLTEAFRPFVQSYAQRVGASLNLSEWEYGYCPVCGSEPNFACLTNTGKRHLYCGFCGFKWPFRRLGCPYCGNVDPYTLGFLETKGGVYRIYVCEQCKRYLKAIDERRAGERVDNPYLAYIATTDLDVVAVRAGYFTDGCYHHFDASF